ncbi:MAG: hypothetical protein WBO29_10730 [Albidovulum sp.]
MRSIQLLWAWHPEVVCFLLGLILPKLIQIEGKCHMRIVRKSIFQLIARFFLFFPLGFPALAQSQGSEARMLVTEVMNRHLAASFVHELDRTAAWIAYVEGVALMGEHEDWPTEKAFEEASVRSFVYDVHNLKARLVVTVVELRRNVKRSQVFTPEEQVRFDAILQDVDTMIEGSQDLYAMLREGRLDEAGEYYRTQTRPLFRKVNGDTFTLISGIEKDLKKARLKIRTLE